MHFSPRFQAYCRLFFKILLLWIIIAGIVAIGIWLGVDRTVIAVAVTVFATLTNAFSGLLSLIALIPFIGPLIVKVVTLPIFWILNGLGYWLSVFAIRRGYTKEVLNYRVLTVVFLLGIVFGYILGKII